MKRISTGYLGSSLVFLSFLSILLLAPPLAAADCPTITISPATLPAGTAGTAYPGTGTTISQSGGAGTPSYAVTSGVLPSGLSLNSSSGAITGTPVGPGLPKKSIFTISATDTNGCTGGRTYAVTVSCPTVTVNPATLPNGTVGTAYSASSITGSGGTAPYTYTVSAGALPTPLVLNSSTGAITGIPDTAGLYSFTIMATDANGCSGSQSYTNVRICPIITLASLTTCANVGTAYSSSAAASGGSGTYTYAVTSGGLPPPLAIAPGTGAVTGTPSTAGSFTFTVTATDTATSCTGAQSYTINVLNMTPAAGALPDATFGTLYTQNLTASGGIGGFTYAVTLGTLPGGVSLTGNQITGTPSGATGTGDFSFTITATNTTTGCTIAKAYTIKSHPVANANTYPDGAGNTEYYAGGFATPTTPFVSSATNILTNDLGPGLTATIVTQPANGTVTLNSDGSFRYTPNAGANTSASFTYKATSNGVDSATNATVTITLVGRVWYVNSSAGVGSGTSNSPFNTLNAADVPSTTNDIVFVHTGGATTTGNITLDAGQVLWGQGTAFALGGSGLAIGAATKPTLTGTVTLGGSNITISSVDIATSAGTALSDNVVAAITGISVINNVTIAATNNPAVVLSDVTTAAGGMVFSSLSSATSGATGVSLTNVSGTFTGSAGSIATATGTDFFISGGAANVSYAGTITDDAGQLVSVASTTGGTKTFSGAISDGPTADDGGGISLTSNTGATINFTGGLALSTGATAAFAATGGGTLNICALNPCGSASAVVNTLTTTGATALNVTSTAIGANNLVFQSITANGAAKGIILNTTGAGSLSVTGTGTTAGSGGTISNMTARGGEFISTNNLSLKNMNFSNASTSDGGACTDLSTSACNAAIYLSSVSTVTLDRVSISGATAQQGINGITVSNFTLSNSTIANCGNAVEEGCVKMRELTGTSAITNSDLSLPGQDVVEIVNTIGPSLTLNVTGSTFRDSQSSGSGGNGLQVRSQGTASVVLNVTNSSFLRLRTNGLQATAINSATNDVDVTTSTFDPGTGTMIGLDLDADNTGVLKFNIVSNTKIYSRNGPAINVFGDTSAVIDGRINNNTDVQVKSGVAGSNVGSGIRANLNKNTSGRIEVKTNTVNVGSDDAGIDLTGIGKTVANPGGATNTLDATVTGNNVTIGATSTYGVFVISASNAGDTNAICLNAASNVVTRNPASIGSFRARVPSAAGFFRLQGFNTDAGITWNNNGNTPINDSSFGGSGVFGSCTATLPTNPVLN